MDYYIKAGSQTDLDNALVLEQCIEDSMGKDFVDLEILTYVSNYTSEVRELGIQSLAINSYAEVMQIHLHTCARRFMEMPMHGIPINIPILLLCRRIMRW